MRGHPPGVHEHAARVHHHRHARRDRERVLVRRRAVRAVEHPRPHHAVDGDEVDVPEGRGSIRANERRGGVERRQKELIGAEGGD
eukprot:31430-Pelagococcus_subviridis.AAC.1